MRQRFPVGSAVLCLWEGGEQYAARVMKYDEKRGYKVHFTGWNSRHDQWVDESKLRTNKNPVLETPTQGPVRYSPEPESSKKKNGKRRREDERPPEKEGRMDRKEEKDAIVGRERTDHKSKRKIEILPDTPPQPAKRSKSARMKYSPPPKPVVPVIRSRGRPPKTLSGAFPVAAVGPSTSTVDTPLSPSRRSRYGRYEDGNETSGSATSSNRVLSPSTVRRRKKETKGGLEIDETQKDVQRTPQRTPRPLTGMGSPTTSRVLTTALDLYIEYGGKLRSPDERTRRNLSAENKTQVIANIVENFKRDEQALADERRRRTVQWCNYLQMKKHLVKDFEKYLVPARGAPTPAVRSSALLDVLNEGDENEREVKLEDIEMEEDGARMEENGGKIEDYMANIEEKGGMMEEREVKMEVEEPVVVVVKEEIKEEIKEEVEEEIEVKKEGGSPTAATTASPTDSSPKPSVPTCSSSSTTAAAEAQEQQSSTTVSSPPVGASKMTPLTVTTSGASGGVTPSPSPAIPQNLIPNPNVPQDQSYAHIPFVGAATGRDVVSQMKADRAQQMRVGTYLQQQNKAVHNKSYMTTGNGMRSVGSSSNGHRGMGRQPMFVTPSLPTGYSVNGKTPLLMQPKKMMHESDLMQRHSYYGGPSTSSGGRGMNGTLKRDWYAAQQESIEFVDDDFSQGVVAEEIVVTAEDVEMDGTEPGPSRNSPHQFATSEVRADHCYGTTSAAKARMREQHRAISREYATSGQGGSTVVSATNYAAGGNGVRQRLVVPRQYNTVTSGAPMLPSSSSVRSVVSLANTPNVPTTTGYNTPQSVYIGVRPQHQTGGAAGANVARTIRFRPAPGVPPVLHTGVGGAGNVRLVDSRRMRPVYVRSPNGMTTATGQPFGVATNRAAPAASSLNLTAPGGGLTGGAGGNQRRVAYVAQPQQQQQQANRQTTRLIVPKGSGSGGVTMAAARAPVNADAAAAAETAVNSQPPVLQPETAVQGAAQ